MGVWHTCYVSADICSHNNSVVGAVLNRRDTVTENNRTLARTEAPWRGNQTWTMTSKQIKKRMSDGAKCNEKTTFILF